ncbi:putative B3 domain-containing protein At5g58280 [Papaver somniferum]|uniref:putative B3 domain-containing protein At5g58280 n=1 Tax=Papaver somniferum TaxID=3469 RepID=UPI000E6F958E|nr:putative B3 domain-containing protein At5g58280 [Papaver somniferum]
MVLEDEEGSIYDTKYLGEFAVLSGGWKPFVEDHELDDGDALVLELVQPRRLKVYIFRVPNGGSEAKVHEIKEARENESVEKVHNFDEDMADVDYTEQITIPTKRRTQRKLYECSPRNNDAMSNNSAPPIVVGSTLAALEIQATNT